MKRYLLDRAKILRPHHEFNRISEEAQEHFPNQLSHPADQLIRRHLQREQRLERKRFFKQHSRLK